MSLLTIAQNSADLLSITRPSAVVSSSDQQIRQLYAIIQEEGYDLASSYNWQALTEEQTFVTVAAAQQVAAIAADWDRFIPDSFFNRTLMRKVFGPVTPQTWQAIQAMPQLNSVFLAFRERGGYFLISPTPPAGQTIAYEYVSAYWAKSASGTPQAQFALDTDLSYLNEQLMTLGVRWRWKKSKGLPFQEDQDTYEQNKEQIQARDGGASAINTTGVSFSWGVNIPEGNFPSS